MTERQQQAINTKNRILEISKRLFLEKGFDNVTIDEIAGELGMSKGALYHHFKSKDAIILWIYRQDYDTRIMKEMEPHLQTETAAELLHRYIHFTNKYNAQLSYDFTKQYMRILMSTSSKDEDSLKFRGIYHLLDAIVQRGLETGEFSQRYEKSFYVDYLAATTNGLYNLWVTYDAEIDIDLFTERALGMLIQSLH